jgi:hypothetical protein
MAIPTSSTMKGYPVIVGPDKLHQNRVAGNGSRPCEEFANPSPLSKELFLSIEIGNCNATSPSLSLYTEIVFWAAAAMFDPPTTSFGKASKNSRR